MVQRQAYDVADIIGVQASANLVYLGRVATKPGVRVEVLWNWLAEASNIGCSIVLDATPLAGRTIFVYAGNMGVAQGVDIFIDLADRLKHRRDVGFLFVGRGSELPRLRAAAVVRGINNVLFRDEVDPKEIPGLLAQCHVGLLALDP